MACGERDGTRAPTSPTASATQTPVASSTVGVTLSSSPAATTAVAAPSASASTASNVDPLDTPELLDVSGKALTQTEERPTTTSAAFKRRMEVLFEAIVKDDPKLAERVFFPVVAYEQVKDIEAPAKDWKHRLWKAFERNIHGYHKKLGEDASGAKLLGVEIAEERVKWMKPGSEGNRVGYFRITRSKIRYADASGREKTLALTSLISWRGEWFVVHLDGFK